jgi:DNA-binding NtrC family response regulator
MPGMDGVETLRRLQQVAPGLTVYIITAFHQVYLEALKQIQSEGITFQLAKKPLAAADIREITRSVLEGPEASRHE